MLIFWTIYIGLGFFILMEGMVEAWRLPYYSVPVKIIGFIICALIWPAVFFMGDK